MGMGGTGGPTRAQIITEAKRQIRDLEGRVTVAQESIRALEAAMEMNDRDGNPRQDRAERMLEAIINVQLTTLRGHITEANIKLTEMQEGVKKAESPIQTAGQMPAPHPHPKRF